VSLATAVLAAIGLPGGFKQIPPQLRSIAMMNGLRLLLAGLVLTLATGWQLSAQETAKNKDSFALHDGDVIVFYGDSITEQRLYTADIENFLLTRYPGRKVQFVNSGVGGDKVSGGWAGPVDMRLARDVFAYRPTVITIMLGMNDGYYRPWDDGIFSTYTDGYRHIVDQILKELPQARLTLLSPSPYDEVTRVAEFTPGYNTALIRFGDFLAKLAEEKHAQLADLNLPVVEALTKVKASDAPLSIALIRDRVHPGDAIHWVMAGAVLKVWGADPVVTSTAIDFATAKVSASVNTAITKLTRTKTELTWTQTDSALPLPLPPAETDPMAALAFQVSDFNAQFNLQLLVVQGLAEGNYELQIDGHAIGRWSSPELAKGINLGSLDTPMLAQSRLVALDTEQKNSLERVHFSLLADAKDAERSDTLKRLETALPQAVQRQRKDAQPVPHRYTLTRVEKKPG
jgi:lysophospholipase L1-like esterase